MRGIAALILGLAVGLLPAVAAVADEYADQASVQKKMAQQGVQVAQAGEALSKAVAEVQRSQTELQNAQAALSDAQNHRAAAEQEDKKKAEELAAAQRALQVAQAEVADGKRRLEEQRGQIASLAKQAYQQKASLTELPILFSARTTSDFANRLQWNDQIMREEKEVLGRLTRLQQKLEDAERSQAEAERAADQARAAAASALAERQAAEAAAGDQASKVAELLAANEAAKAKAQAQMQSEQQQLAELQAESSRVEQAIQARLAREQAQRAAAEAEAARQAAASAAAAAAASAASGQPGPAPQSSGGALGNPIPGAPFTSFYGPRFHPVLHTWGFHDGLDLGAECGTPIHSAADGEVVAAYYNTGGYGWQAQVDHGLVAGRNVTTSYSHATHFVVAPGQHVAKGEILGYVGSTGYSTGCHLHYMVYVAGHHVDPINWI